MFLVWRPMAAHRRILMAMASLTRMIVAIQREVPAITTAALFPLIRMGMVSVMKQISVTISQVPAQTMAVQFHQQMMLTATESLIFKTCVQARQVPVLVRAARIEMRI